MKEVLIYVSVYKTQKEFNKHWGLKCCGVSMHRKTTSDKKNHIYLFKNDKQQATLKHEIMHILFNEFNLMQKIPKDELIKINKIKKKVFEKMNIETETKNKSEEFLVLLFDVNKQNIIKEKLPITFKLIKQMKKRYKVITKQRTRTTF